jgi:hypothetical protein
MKFYLAGLFSAFFFFSCSPNRKVVNNISCPGFINLQYDKTTAKGVMAKKDLKKVTIFFLNYFNDSIKLYINGNLKFQDLVVTDSVSGKSEKSFSYDYSNDRTLPIMKVEFEGGNCFDIQIIEKYKIVYLFNDNFKRWTIRFSNRYYVDN